MSTHNIQLHDKITKKKQKKRKQKKTKYIENFVGNQSIVRIAMVNEPSVFVLLRFDCIFPNIQDLYCLIIFLCQVFLFSSDMQTAATFFVSERVL